MVSQGSYALLLYFKMKCLTNMYYFELFVIIKLFILIVVDYIVKIILTTQL